MVFVSLFTQTTCDWTYMQIYKNELNIPDTNIETRIPVDSLQHYDCLAQVLEPMRPYLYAFPILANALQHHGMFHI